MLARSTRSELTDLKEIKRILCSRESVVMCVSSVCFLDYPQFLCRIESNSASGIRARMIKSYPDAAWRRLRSKRFYQARPWDKGI